MNFRLTNEPVTQLGLMDHRAGARVVFEGAVRNETSGQEVVRLEYEAYVELAEKEGLAVLVEAKTRFDVLDASAVHRIGVLLPGDTAVRVEVVSAHRQAAFEACAWIMDEVKKRVPIWKKEVFAAGQAEWVGSEMTPPS